MPVVVWKSELPNTGEFDLELPTGARILHVHEYGGRPYVWVLADPEAPPEKRQFRLLDTGEVIDHPPAARLRYIGSFHLGRWEYVGHLFEVFSTDELARRM